MGRIRHGDGEPIASLCCNPADEHSTFAATGSSVLCLDLRKGLGEEAVLDTLSVNSDEINSIDVDPTGTWIAAGDDSGEVQVISIASISSSSSTSSKPTYKTLRRGHSNICSSVVFRPSKPSELLSGGLDCKMVRWDFQKLRQLSTFDMNTEAMAAANGQFCNPPMVNALAMCTDPVVEFPTLVGAARGDGCVALYNAEYRPTASSSGKEKKGGSSAAEEKPSSALIWAAGTHQGGHTAAVNCVTFVPDSSGKRLFSVGNDRKFCVWDWQNAVEPAGTLQHRAKINWVCGVAEGVAEMDAVLGDVSGRLVAVTLDA